MMFNNRDFFIDIEILHKIKEGTVPVPCLYPPLRLVILEYCLFWSYRIREQARGEAPWNVRIRH